MESILFHGSNKIISNPTKAGGKVHNDFGQGFYCTPDIELAREWACTETPTAFANHYSFEPSYTLEVCNLSGPDYHVLNWLAVLMVNRVFETSHGIPATIKKYIIQEFLPDLSGYDVIRGYRADDSYFQYSNLFLSGTISLEELSRAMRLGNLGEQVFLKSEKAFEALVFTSAEIVDRDVYLAKRLARESKARDAFQKIKHGPEVFDSIFAIDVYRNKMKNDDPRLR